MNKNVLLAILLLISSLAFSQSKSIYGPIPRISQADVDMTEYDKDKDAEALVLYDCGISYFFSSTGGFDLIFERTLRVKILKESGLDWAEISIPYYTGKGNEEEIKEITGITYNYDNGVPNSTHLDKEQTYVEVHNKYWSTLKVPMPNVKVGSIFEIKYKTTTKSIYHLHDWEFQWDIPVVHSEYQVSLTPFYIYKWILQGANKFDTKKSQKHQGLDKSIHGIDYKEMTHNYVMKDVPAFKDAEYITTRDDFIMKMDWQLIEYISLSGIKTEVMSSWKKITKEFYKDESVGKFISKSEKKAAKLLDMVAISNKSDKEKVEHILNYVKGNYKWNEIRSKQASVSVNKFISNKEGLSGELNLFATGLLNAAGIEANIAFISTRDNGRIYYDYPFTHYFNYNIIYAKVDGEYIFLDATNPNISNWSIPSKCLNGKGLLIHDGDVKWVPIKSTTHSEKTYDLKYTLMDDELLAQSEYTYTGYYGFNQREHILDDSYNVAENLMEDDGVIEESVEVLNIDNAEAPVIIKFDYIKESPFDHDKVYFTPFSKVITENPFKEKSRRYPIDFVNSKKVTYKSTIKIPEGFEVEYMKTDFETIDNDYYQISYNSKIEDGNVIVEFSYWTKKARYPSTAYGRLKHYFNDVVELGQEKVVFKKTE